MSHSLLRRAAPTLVLLLMTAGCGQSIDTPTGLEIRDYPANQAFTMTFTMQSCSDSCATYERPECCVDVDGSRINVDVSVAFERNEDDESCTNVCGPPIFADCEVPALDPGSYRVDANGFRVTIQAQ